MLGPDGPVAGQPDDFLLTPGPARAHGAERRLVVKHAAVDGRSRPGTIGETCGELLKVVKPSADVSIAEAP